MYRVQGECDKLRQLFWHSVAHMGSPLGDHQHIFMFLAHKTSYGFKYSSFFSHQFIFEPFSAYLQGLYHCHLLPGPSFLLWKFEWNPSWSHNSCILYDCKTTIMLMIIESSTICLWDTLSHSCSSLWEPGHTSLTKTRPRKQDARQPCIVHHRICLLKGRSVL